MSNWRGFVRESKEYMNHPDCWKKRGDWAPKDRRRAKLDFWLRFPRAWIRFYALMFRDWLRATTGLA